MPLAESTNTLLKQRAAEGEKAGRVIVAHKQSAGRGRKGRSFHSEGGVGIYMSILLRPDFSLERTALLTCLAAVATARAIEPHSKAPIGIKWVNDLYIEEKKVCGILTESAASGDKPLYTVVGIGVNLYMPEGGFPKQIREIATALFYKEEDARREYEGIITKILDEFFKLYSEFETLSFVEEYKRRSILNGKRVFVEGRACTVLGIDDDCRLLVQYGDGKRAAIGFGEAVTKAP